MTCAGTLRLKWDAESGPASLYTLNEYASPPLARVPWTALYGQVTSYSYHSGQVTVVWMCAHQAQTISGTTGHGQAKEEDAARVQRVCTDVLVPVQYELTVRERVRVHVHWYGLLHATVCPRQRERVARPGPERRMRPARRVCRVSGTPEHGEHTGRDSAVRPNRRPAQGSLPPAPSTRWGAAPIAPRAPATTPMPTPRLHLHLRNHRCLLGGGDVVHHRRRSGRGRGCGAPTAACAPCSLPWCVPLARRAARTPWRADRVTLHLGVRRMRQKPAGKTKNAFCSQSSELATCTSTSNGFMDASHIEVVLEMLHVCPSQTSSAERT